MPRRRRRIVTIAATCLLPFAGLAAFAGAVAFADVPAPAPGGTDASPARLPDLIGPQNWAYRAVEDLARRGWVQGYPAEPEALGGRMVSRYELAAVVKRAIAGFASSSHTKRPTEIDRAILSRLVKALRPELLVLGADLTLVERPAAASGEPAQQHTSLPGGGETASGGPPPTHPVTAGGYVQSRYLFGPASKTLYPEGAAAKTSPYNGAYAEGGTSPSFLIRRARVELRGAVTDHTRVALTLECSGTTDASTVSNGINTIIRQAAVQYTFGSGDPVRSPSITAGAIANPFGYLLNESPATAINSERPLIANESGAGLFPTQDWDRGVRIEENWHGFTGTLGLLNGTGYTSNETHRPLDRVARLSWKNAEGFSVGISHYDGQLTGSGIGTGLPAAGTGYQARRRNLLGLDARFLPTGQGPFVLAEYVGGRYEQISAFGLAASPTLTNLSGYGTIAAPRNRVCGGTVEAGFRGIVAGRTIMPFLSWDTLRRSSGGRADSGSAWDDTTWGIGVHYHFDAATRLRLFTNRPIHVAAAPMPNAPSVRADKAQLAVAELQVRF